MTGSEREGLIARIRQVRRHAAPRDQPTVGGDPQPPALPQDLAGRVAHLEQLVEGLQDSVHRESERYSKLIAELQLQVQPDAIRTALAEDSRSRGI